MPYQRLCRYSVHFEQLRKLVASGCTLAVGAAAAATDARVAAEVAAVQRTLDALATVLNHINDEKLEVDNGVKLLRLQQALAPFRSGETVNITDRLRYVVHSGDVAVNGKPRRLWLLHDSVLLAKERGREKYEPRALFALDTAPQQWYV